MLPVVMLATMDSIYYWQLVDQKDRALERACRPYILNLTALLPSLDTLVDNAVIHFTV